MSDSPCKKYVSTLAWLACLSLVCNFCMAAPTNILEKLSSLKSTEADQAPDAAKQIIRLCDDPTILLKGSQIVRQKFIDPAINQLEYWGEDTNSSADLTTGIQAASLLLKRADQQASQRASTIASEMRGPDDQSHLPQWQHAAGLARRALFEQLMLDYARVLSMNSMDPSRPVLAKKDISTLQNWTNDAQVGAVAQLTIGKLNLAVGNFSQARVDLAKVKGGAATKYQARYFMVLTDLAAGQLDQARQQAEQLSAASSGESAARQILLYRIDCAAADHSNEKVVRGQYNQKAIAAIRQLINDHPDLAQMALSHLARRVTMPSDVGRADPLILRAIMHRAAQDQNDPQALRDGLRAATAVLNRPKDFQLEATKYAAALSAMIQQRQNDPAGAAHSYFKLAELMKQADPATARAALDQSIQLLRALHQSKPNDATILDLYQRVLSTAAASPFARTDLLYERACLLEQQGKYTDAATVFSQVPDRDPNYLPAQLQQMICLRHQLTANNATQLSARIEQLRLRIVNQTSESRHNATIAAQANLVAAEMRCDDLHDPAGAITLLDNFSATIAKLSNADDLKNQALAVRIRAMMSLDRLVEAARLMTSPHDQRFAAANPRLAYELFNRLGAELDKARGASDDQRIRTLAECHADLAGLLARWAGNDADPKARAGASTYRLIQARSALLAISLEHESPDRTAALEQLGRQFQELLAPGALALTQQPLASLGLAGVKFNVHQYSQARRLLVDLLNQRRLGSPIDAGAEHYWEAAYELLASDWALVEQKQATPDEEKQARSYLARLEIEWGPQVGGKYWSRQFEQLRVQMGITAPAATAGRNHNLQSQSGR